MAEIKSSIEIALERAAAMGSASDDRARQEGRKKGKAMARRFMSGDIDTLRLGDELSRLDAAEASHARAAALETMATELERGEAAAAAGLQELAAGTEAAAAADALQELARDQQEEEAALVGQLSLEMAEQLSAAGISGTAVVPNPGAHPELTARHDAIVAQRAAKRAELLEQVRAVLLQP